MVPVVYCNRFRGLILLLVSFPLCHVWSTMGHWEPHSSLASCWAEKSGFPTSNPMLSWLNHMGCFPMPCLGPLSSSWLRYHWSLSQDTHPPVPQSQVLLGMWLFLECSVTLELWPLIPRQEDLRRWIPTMRDQCESPNPQHQSETVGFLQLVYSVHSWQEVKIQVCRI